MAQLRTFDHAVKVHGNTSMWMAFIDVDEFLWSPGPITVTRARTSVKGRPAGTVPSYLAWGYDVSPSLGPSEDVADVGVKEEEEVFYQETIEEPSLRDFLAEYEEFGGVLAHWVVYGSSGYEEVGGLVSLAAHDG